MSCVIQFIHYHWLYQLLHTHPSHGLLLLILHDLYLRPGNHFELILTRNNAKRSSVVPSHMQCTRIIHTINCSLRSLLNRTIGIIYMD